jgi:hypothetical protein
MRRFIVGAFGIKGEESLRSIYGLAGALWRVCSRHGTNGTPSPQELRLAIGVNNRPEATIAKDFKRDETSLITKYRTYESALDSFF